MFSIYMPATFKVGDTADTTINGERRRLHYKDAETLVIEPGEEKHIDVMMFTNIGGTPCMMFWCST
jgi:hypothetical protein